MRNAEAGPSHGPMPGPAFPSKPVTDQLGIDTMYQEDNVEIDVVYGDLNIAGEHALNAETLSAPLTPSHSIATFITSHTSGSTINVNGNFQSQVNHHHHGAPPLNSMHSLSPFNDAPVDRISPCFMGREDDIQAIASAVGSCYGDAPSRYAVWGMPGLGKSQLALSPEQSAKLLLKRAGIHSSAAADLDSAQKLVKRIGCLPLAVEQAGAYMKRSGFTGAGQLETLYDQQGLQEVISWDNSLSTYEEKSVLTTITIQFQRLDEIDPHLLMLLHVLTFFDLENIPLDIIVLGAGRVSRRLAASEISKSTIALTPEPKHSLLRQWIGQISNRWNQPSTNVIPNPGVDVASAVVSVELRPLLGLICSETWLRGALRHLEDLSLARPLYGGERASLHIHDLIQLVFRRRKMTDQLADDSYHAFATTLLCRAFEQIKDVESPQYWTECERFVPHLMSLAKHGTPTIALLAMSGQVALYFRRRGRYDEGVALCQKALAGQEQQLGAEHRHTLATVHNLALMYRQQGQYDKAETLFRRALAGNERRLGKNHRKTLDTVNGLATLYNEQGRYAKAKTLYRRVLAGHEKQLGPDHPNALPTVHNLALLYVQQGRYDEAEPLYHRALGGQERQLGVDHPNTLNTVHGLAILYQQQGRYDEAEILCQRALKGQERQLGADHSDTLDTIHNLARLRVQQGRYYDAETLYNRALTGREKMIGTCHPHTLGTIKALAELYDRQGRLQEAQMVRDKALKRTTD